MWPNIEALQRLIQKLLNLWAKLPKIVHPPLSFSYRCGICDWAAQWFWLPRSTGKNTSKTLYLCSSSFGEEVIPAAYPDVFLTTPQLRKERATGAGLINRLTTFLFLSEENANSKTALNRTSEQKSFKFTGEAFKPLFNKVWQGNQILDRHGLFGVNRSLRTPACNHSLLWDL